MVFKFHFSSLCLGVVFFNFHHYDWLTYIPCALFIVISVDYCFSNPCQNNATCTRRTSGGQGYDCQCEAGYLGTHCEIGKICYYIIMGCLVPDSPNPLSLGLAPNVL